MAERFASDGILRLDAFERGLEFDAQYFRETRPAWEGVDDAACHGAWLRETDAEHPSSPRDHLEKLGLKITVYPAAFPWRSYSDRRPRAGANRWTALDDFVVTGFAEEEDIQFGPGAADFLVALARSYSGHRDRLAIKAFELARQYDDLGSEEYQHLADSYLRERLYRPAQRIYFDIWRDGHAHVWTIHNLVTASKALHDWPTALEIVTSTRLTMGTDPLWEKTARETVDGFFEAQIRLARICYRERQRSRGDAIVATAVMKTVAALERLEPPRAQHSRGARVLLLGNGDDHVGRHYRIELKGRLFDALGVEWAFIPMQDAETLEASLGDARVVIFFQTPATPKMLRALLAARRRGIPTVYEVDAPVFDVDCMPLSYERYRGFITPSLHDELKLNVQLYRALAGFCDYGLAPTHDIAARLAPLVRRAEAFVLEDGGDERQLPSFPGAKEGEAANVFMRSARFVCIDPQTDPLGRAVLDLLEHDATVRLTVSGHVRLANAFDKAGDRIAELGETGFVGDHLHALAGVRANIIPDTYAGDSALAGVNWLEAARFGVPSVMGSASAKALGLVGGRDCLTVDAAGDWVTPIRALLEDPALAKRIGDAARSNAATERGLPRLARSVERLLRETAAGGADEQR